MMGIHLYQYIFVLLNMRSGMPFHFAEFLDCSSTFERAAAMIILAYLLVKWSESFVLLSLLPCLIIYSNYDL